MRDLFLALLPGPHTPPGQSYPSCCLYSAPGLGVGELPHRGGVGSGVAQPQPPAPCLRQAWAGPPRGSFLVSFVVTAPTGKAPGVSDTQSTTLGTNLETGKQTKLK